MLYILHYTLPSQREFGSPVLPEKEKRYQRVSRPLSIYLISGQNSHLPVKTFSSKAQSTRQRKQLFWHGVKVVCFLPIPPFYTDEITMTVGRCAELEEFFA